MKALIFGATGQDGSYLAEFLLQKGYRVLGVRRWCSGSNISRIEHLSSNQDFEVQAGDITDAGFVHHIIATFLPDEIYNLAAVSSTRYTSYESVIQTNGIGPLHIYDAVQNLHIPAKIFQASTAEIFDYNITPQNTNTAHYPTTVYGSAKLMAQNVAEIYRKEGLHISCGILFNHESPRRTEDYVSRKITASAVRIATNRQERLRLWDVTSIKDWGFAGDYVEAMWLMLQQDQPTDYVIGTGESHTVAEFCNLAFTRVGLNWRDHVDYPAVPASKYAPVPRADIQKIKHCLKWQPTVNFNQLVSMMMDHDMSESYRSAEKAVA